MRPSELAERPATQGAVAAFGVAALLLCLLTGLMIALLPPAILVRLAVLPLGLLGLLVLCALPKRAGAPDGLLNGLLLLLLGLIHLWPSYLVYRFGGLPAVNPTRLAWLAFLLPAVCAILSCRAPLARLLARWRAHPLLVSAVPFLFAWRVLSSAAGEQPLAQVLHLGSEVVSCYLVFFVALAVLRDETDVYRLLAVLVLVALVQAGLAAYESLLRHTLFERFIVPGNDDALTMLDTLRQKFRDGQYRAQGTFEHPMVLAEFLAMMVPLAAALAVARGARLLRWAGAGFIPLAVAMIVASRSRAGILVLLLAVLLAGALPLARAGRARGGGLLPLACALLLPLLLALAYFGAQELGALVAGRSRSEAGSTLARLLMLERGLPLLAASPLLGYGGGMGAVKLGFYDGVRFNVDNYWLGLALDAGLPGLAALAVVLGGAVWLGLRVWRRRADRAGTLAGAIAIAIVMLIVTKSVLSISSGLTLAYILFAAVLALEPAPAAPPGAGAGA